MRGLRARIGRQLARAFSAEPGDCRFDGAARARHDRARQLGRQRQRLLALGRLFGFEGGARSLVTAVGGRAGRARGSLVQRRPRRDGYRDAPRGAPGRKPRDAFAAKRGRVADCSPDPREHGRKRSAPGAEFSRSSVMKAASRPRARDEQERLLVIDPARDAFADYQIDALPQFFRQGDALVLNDAATLPASLRAGPDLELRLMSELEDGTWLALCLGRGDYRIPTEERGAPPQLALGDELCFGHGLSARVRWLDPSSSRLLRIEFEQRGGQLWQALYRAAAPIQYAYVPAPLALWDVQNAYAARP